MNQTKKRLNIINLAITMTDIETIQMQTMKLNMLKSDIALQEIIQTLHAQNYAKAQKLINDYMDGEHSDVIQRTEQYKFEEPVQEVQEVKESPQEDAPDFEYADLISLQKLRESAKQGKPIQHQTNVENVVAVEKTVSSTDKHKENLEKLKIFEESIQAEATPDSVVENQESNFEEKKELFEESLTSENTTDVDNPASQDTSQKEFEAFDTFLNKDTFTEKVTIDIAHTTHEENERLKKLDKKAEPKAFFSLTNEKSKNKKNKQKKNKTTLETETETKIETDIKHEQASHTVVEAEKEPDSTALEGDTELNKETRTPTNIDTKPYDAERTYVAIPNLEQRFKNLYTHYCPLFESDTTYLSVDSLLLQLTNENFTEQTIFTVLSDLDKLAQLDKAEAAELLLVSAATEINFARFILARELYKGNILEQNIPESFLLMEKLAQEGLGEAMCDLGQFYENGVGTEVSNQKALEFYGLAMETGVARAEPHLKRLKKKSKGLLSSLIGSK